MSELDKTALSTRVLTESLRSLDDPIGPPRSDDGDLLGRVKRRVMGVVKQECAAAHRTVRSDGGVWEQVAPGIERKMLWDAGDAMSYLMRLAPGASVGPHGHLIDEECLVLEGSLCIGTELVLRPGDFHVGVKGVPHDQAHSETGALLFLRSSKEVEFS